MKRLTKQEKLNLLEFLKGDDDDSYKVGWKMCKTYLNYFPNEQNFKRKLKKLRRSNRGKYIWYNDLYNSSDQGIQIQNPTIFSNITYVNE